MRAIVGQEHLDRVAAYPGGRIGEPEDIVALANVLCSDAASHLSGTVSTVRPPVTRRPSRRQRPAEQGGHA
jgi:3-oxoacyl-[acyl-carrier protein] reductase